MKLMGQLMCLSLLVLIQSVDAAFAASKETDSKSITLKFRTDERLGVYIGLENNRVVRFANVKVTAVSVDPPIADVTVDSKNQVTIHGKTPGSANMVISQENGKSLDVNIVVRDFNALQSTLTFIDPRIKFKHRVVGGAEQLVFYGVVDKPETIIKAYSAGNVFMDDRGINWMVSDKLDPVPLRNGAFGAPNYSDQRWKVGTTNLISDGRRVLSLLAIPVINR